MRRPTLTAARLASAAGAALLAAVLIVGAAAAAKKQKLVEVTNSITLQGQPNGDGPFDSGTATSTCPKKKQKLAFGGYSADADLGPGAGIVPFSLQRTSERDWAAGGGNSNEGAGNLTSIGYCGKVKKLTEIRGTANLGPLGQGTATATCPKKTSVRLGGFEGQFDPADLDPAVVTTSMVRSSKRTLQVAGANAAEDSRGTLDAIAYCGKGPKLKQVASTVAVPPVGDLAATATCPKSKRLAFGGFEGEVDLTDFDPVVFVHTIRRASKRGWSAAGLNFAGLDRAGSPGNVTAYAYCGKKE